eukprot:scaffold3037_cov230-Pinguiococcus_pyrenoidosus.AAC.5
MLRRFRWLRTGRGRRREWRGTSNSLRGKRSSGTKRPKVPDWKAWRRQLLPRFLVQGSSPAVASALGSHGFSSGLQSLPAGVTHRPPFMGRRLCGLVAALALLANAVAPLRVVRPRGRISVRRGAILGDSEADPYQWFSWEFDETQQTGYDGGAVPKKSADGVDEGAIGAVAAAAAAEVARARRRKAETRGKAKAVVRSRPKRPRPRGPGRRLWLHARRRKQGEWRTAIVLFRVRPGLELETELEMTSGVWRTPADKEMCAAVLRVCAKTGDWRTARQVRSSPTRRTRIAGRQLSFLWNEGGWGKCEADQGGFPNHADPTDVEAERHHSGHGGFQRLPAVAVAWGPSAGSRERVFAALCHECQCAEYGEVEGSDTVDAGLRAFWLRARFGNLSSCNEGMFARCVSRVPLIRAHRADRAPPR